MINYSQQRRGRDPLGTCNLLHILTMSGTGQWMMNYPKRGQCYSYMTLLPSGHIYARFVMLLLNVNLTVNFDLNFYRIIRIFVH